MRKVSFILLLLVLLLMSIGNFSFAEYPDKEVEWVLWSSPGGGSDITTRTVGIPLRKSLGKPLVIINMPGGNGARAMTYIQNRPADGYTLIFITGTLITAIERGLVDYSIDDFVPVYMFNYDPQTIVVSAKGEIKSLDDLIKLGKERPLKWAMTGLGDNEHVHIDIFAKAVGIKYDPVVYQSGGETVVAALGGVVDVLMGNPSEVIGQVEAGNLNVVCTLSEKRLSIFPDVPTCLEKGYEVIRGTFRGVAVKKGTDPEIIKTLEELFSKAVDSQIYRSFIEDSGMDFFVKGSEDFKVFLDSQYESTAKGIKNVGFATK